VRRLIAFVVVVAACASIASVPGGPEDHIPPKVLSVTPESGAVNVRAKAVVFKFDEVVSDRSGPSSDLNGLFLVSPRDGDPRLSWHRDRIEVRGRKDWRPNTAYTVTLLPGLADLSGNQTKQTTTVVFSTGPTVPRLGVTGVVFDWANERVVSAAVVEAISRPDSTVYVARTDTAGRFTLGPFGPGTYSVRAFVDQNHNNVLDPGEIWDSLHVQIVDSVPRLELLAAKRDTIGPAILNVTPTDTTLLRVTFDKPLDPRAPVDKDHFRVQRADSVALVVLWARTEDDDRRARAKATADSGRAADSLAAIKDPSRRFPPPPPPPPTTPPPPKPSRPAPSTVVLVKIDIGTRLEWLKQYRVTASDMDNLLGFKATTSRAFATPKAPVKTDSTKAPPPKPPAAKPPPS
jgi:hypothetical protein